MASTWHYAGAPQRVQVGILASDANGIRVVTQGAVDLAFSYLGDGRHRRAGGRAPPPPRPTSRSRGPTLPATRRRSSRERNGVYEAEDVTFDEAGIWRATLSIEIDGVARQLTTDFPVRRRST